MRFEDPAEVGCPGCGTQARYSVASLLRLTAACSTCGQQLVDAGRKMRRFVDEWSLFVGRAEVAVYAENELGVELDDHALEATATIADLEALLADHLGSTSKELEPGARLREWLTKMDANPPFYSGRDLTTLFGGTYLECRWEPAAPGIERARQPSGEGSSRPDQARSETSLPSELEIDYFPSFVEDSDALFHSSAQHLGWDDRMRARRTASCGVAYNYSGISYPDTTLPPFLEPVFRAVEQTVGHVITNCLANFYADGDSNMGFHSDSAEGVVPGTTTSILSLGAPRALVFRRKSDRAKEWPMMLASGSLLVMHPSVQDAWQHGIRRTFDVGPRISLTFRNLVRAGDASPTLLR